MPDGEPWKDWLAGPFETEPMRLAAEFLQAMNELLLLNRKAASTPLEHLSRVIWFTVVPVQHGLVILGLIFASHPISKRDHLNAGQFLTLALG